MRALILFLAGVLIAGCATLQTEIIEDPGRVDSLAVGRFTTRDPADGELFASYLKSELSRIGFDVVDNSQNVLSGAITFNYLYHGETFGVNEAIIVLKKDSDQIVWRYKDDGIAKLKKEFAIYITKQIAKKLRE